ncbi:TRAP transporter, DctM subunit [Clostridiales bacterium 1_7_47FAA]|uniref:TRAP transporter large permease n=1 Tax=Enterocloster hominis (ex Hitch et al. 2024) TaxID=1917870 RepID=A0ABV1D5E6_9FIRM|nr:TRAP transporter, DctM subunit [Clostridiales bacterium 1_7_47FAA]
MQMAVYLFLLLFGILFLGVPIGIGMCASVLITLKIWGEMPLNMIFRQYYQGVDSYSLLAIPMFVLAGELMMQCGLIRDIMRLCKIFVGRFRGGLAHVNILASVLFAAMSGSAVADTASIGSMLIPTMEEEGYDAEFSVAVTASSSCLSPMIPPSIPMVIYSSTMSMSTAAMFMGGVIPGILVACALGVIVIYQSKKHNYPKEEERVSVRVAIRTMLECCPAIITPCIIMIGVFTGWFTATESAAIACVWVLIVGKFYYRTLTKEKVWKALVTSMTTAGGILIINAAAKPLSYLVAFSGVPSLCAQFITAHISSRYVVLFLINIILLILGATMECSANILIFAPILVPMAISYGVDPLAMGVIFCINCAVGICTPPFGPTLFIGSAIAKKPVTTCMKAVLPFCMAEIAIIFLITYIPGMITFLPKMFGLY